MTENEAAAPDPSKPDPSKAAERPRPRYGELAPEGWEWKPPTPAEPIAPAAAHPPVPAPAPAQLPAPQGAPWHPAPPAGGQPAGAKPLATRESLRTDRRITLALLIFGLFGLWMAINTLTSIPEALQTLHSQAGLADYVAGEADMRTILIGNVAQALLWALTAIWAWLRMQNTKRAFWIPLLGGALSLILLFTVVGVIAVNDPLFLQLAPAP